MSVLWWLNIIMRNEPKPSWYNSVLLAFFHSETIFKARKKIQHIQMSAVLCSLCLHPYNEPLLPYFVHRFDPGIQMRSYLDWMMATMQLTLITRYSLLSIFLSFCIIMEYPVLIPLALFFAVWLRDWNTDMWLLQDQSERKKNSQLQVDQSSVRNSYSVFSLLR